MADYYTQFSCLLDVGSAANVAKALDVYLEMEAELDRDEETAIGFLAIGASDRPGQLWISDDAGHGEPEHVIAFALRCAEAFDLTGRWGFVWALTCSRSRLDGFGGGAQVLDLEAHRSLGWLDCDHWLDAALDPACDADTGIARSAADGSEPAMGKGEPVVEGGVAALGAPAAAAP